MKNQKRNIILLVLVSFIVGYFILKDDFSSIMSLICNINIWWFIVALIMIAIYWIFQSLSLNAIVSKEDKPGFAILFKSTIICNFFSAITPFATGGQPFQVYYLKRKGLHLGTATNLVIEQSTLYQIALVIFGTVAIILNYFLDFFPANNFLKELVILGYIINVFVIFLLFFISRAKKTSRFLVMKLVSFMHKIRLVKNKEKLVEKLDNVIDKFYASAKSIKGNKMAVMKSLIYNLLAFLALYIVPLFVAYSLGIFNQMNFLSVLVSSAYVMLIAAFVPIPGGSGGIEFAFVNFFGFYIVGSSLMAMLLLWRFITYYLSIIVGGIVLIIDRDGGK